MTQNIDPQKIRPRVRRVSDKFSWKLFSWVKADESKTSVWRFPNGSLYIGRLHNGHAIIGTHIRTLCQYGGSTASWYTQLSHGTVEITEEFWESYLDIGVCAIHADYAHDWVVDNDKRTCNYCMKTQTREVIQVVTDETRWSDI
jgi:hypothetical protein